LHGAVIEARHIEVQASVRPVSYLCPFAKRYTEGTGRKPMSMKPCTPKELADGVQEWVKKKYQRDAKKRLRNVLYQGEWKYELVIHHIKFPEELNLIEKHGIKIHQLDEIV